MSGYSGGPDAGRLLRFFVTYRKDGMGDMMMRERLDGTDAGDYSMTSVVENVAECFSGFLGKAGEWMLQEEMAACVADYDSLVEREAQRRLAGRDGTGKGAEKQSVVSRILDEVPFGYYLAVRLRGGTVLPDSDIFANSGEAEFYSGLWSCMDPRDEMTDTDKFLFEKGDGYADGVLLGAGSEMYARLLDTRVEANGRRALKVTLGARRRLFGTAKITDRGKIHFYQDSVRGF